MTFLADGLIFSYIILPRCSTPDINFTVLKEVVRLPEPDYSVSVNCKVFGQIMFVSPE